ncbi:hypothetical protein P343_16030 [Sporolactobacillus laevolacticus DSM 442]|uniref:Uncharacterized protein n=1 Tax=Sporolactobacillus laevolacticus DSM 442 TaxID=1395513 RepID=V6IVV5_9BACL|nr:hypothetical protein P343_16030 [Sporolactobacillus laevolacticus DSM 442]
MLFQALRSAPLTRTYYAGYQKIVTIKFIPQKYVEALMRANMPELCVKKYRWAVAE